MTIETLEAFGDALNRRDLGAAMSYFAEECSYQPSAGGTCEGRDAVRRGLETLLAQFQEGRYEDVSFWVCGNRGFGEWTFVGTTVGGRPVRIPGCDLYEFAGDKIKRKNAFRKQEAS
jgi:ketosteroid isomerase-like protein